MEIKCSFDGSLLVVRGLTDVPSKKVAITYCTSTKQLRLNFNAFGTGKKNTIRKDGSTETIFTGVINKLFDNDVQRIENQIVEYSVANKNLILINLPRYGDK